MNLPTHQQPVFHRNINIIWQNYKIAEPLWLIFRHFWTSGVCISLEVCNNSLCTLYMFQRQLHNLTLERLERFEFLSKRQKKWKKYVRNVRAKREQGEVIKPGLNILQQAYSNREPEGRQRMLMANTFTSRIYIFVWVQNGERTHRLVFRRVRKFGKQFSKQPSL